MVTQSPAHGISAVDAFQLAGITYRQLDYWARRGWVEPSIEAGTGRPGRRLYSPGDVIRLATLGHLGRSGIDVGRLGPQVATLNLPTGTSDYLIILGPEYSLDVVPASDLRVYVTAIPGPFVIFDTAPLRRELGDRPSVAAVGSRRTETRSA